MTAEETRAEQAEQRAIDAKRSEEIAVSQMQRAEEKAQRFEQLFEEQSMYDTNVTKVTNGDAITYTVYSFQEDTRSFIEKYANLTRSFRLYSRG
ncbi:hypothetical protein [Lysinibacillus sp. fls2-241-R2A-57]|uniref:hypothetical protein n=1 Tax=Lysinibacillus sp. fls2-241-R2A-57 TaxID=3040292 RepID=UPI002556ECA3|nr:hypothetical protein [Lysinibacillus sp. fls2-241-R2A-57]